MKITLQQSKCIGCGSCSAVCDKYFELNDDGLASIKGGETNGADMELEIKDIGCAQEAADICPVQIISISKQ